MRIIKDPFWLAVIAGTFWYCGGMAIREPAGRWHWLFWIAPFLTLTGSVFGVILAHRAAKADREHFISKEDQREIMRFSELLRDFGSDMEPAKFAEKWAAYLLTSKEQAAKYKRTAGGGQA